MEGLEASEVSLNELEYSGRIDSEYYRPKFLEIEKQVLARGGVELSTLSDFLIGPFGSAFTVDNYTDDPTYRYIRGKDVKPMKLMDSDNAYMPEDDYNRLKKYSLRENDLLVTVVGTLGNAAMISSENLPAIFSCKSTALRPHSINPSYLLVYINTRYGHNLLLRKQRGAVQKGLNLDDLKTLIVYNASRKFQLKIESLFQKSKSLLEVSKEKYFDAESYLLEKLAFKNFKPSNNPINIKSFKNSFLSSGRLDGEYYQVKYEEVIDKITSVNHDTLCNLVNIKKSVEPGSSNYSTDGLPFIRVSDYDKFGFSEPDKHLTKEYCEENSDLLDELKPKKNTILFSKDGSVGNSYLIRSDRNFVTSRAILHLKIKNMDQLMPEYLTLVLNSKLVQMQAERDAGGSIILHWRENEIKEVVIPLLDFDIQNKISALVDHSFNLKENSEKLLETAKRAVEIAIERDERSAFEFIEKECSI